MPKAGLHRATLVSCRERDTKRRSRLKRSWRGSGRARQRPLSQALRGDTTALLLCFERIVPRLRGTSIEISDFPKVVPRTYRAPWRR